MPSYVIFSSHVSADATRRARAAAEGAGLRVVSAAPGSVLVEGPVARVRDALSDLGEAWQFSAERRVITMPERRHAVSPSRRVTRG